MPPQVGATSTIARAARTLVIDAMAVESISALRAEGVRAILLKGATIARWLYSSPELREYADIDLLIAGADFASARRALERLGYVDTFADWAPNEPPPHAHMFSVAPPSRAAAAVPYRAGPPIDLHWSFHGIGGSDLEFWTAVADSTERMHISGTVVEVPSKTTRTLLLALHAPTSAPQPLFDLNQGLQLLSDETWAAAYDLAVRLDAVPRFLTALMMRPLGRSLIDRLGFEGRLDVLAALDASGIPPVAGGVHRLATTPGVRPRARLLAREVAPTPSFMRATSPIARRGRLGLAVAYVYRPIWLLIKLPVALRAHARARRAVKRRLA